MSSIGIDAGGTLVKLAYWQDEEIVTTYFPSARFDLVKEWIITRFENPKICMTGGRAKQLEHFLGSENYQYVVEFDATIQGVMYQLKKVSYKPKRPLSRTLGRELLSIT